MLACADIVDLPRVDGVFLYPFDTDGWRPGRRESGDRVRIVHAPNHRELKGTTYLIDAVAQLEREGLPVELVLVEGRTGGDARRIYEEADIVADQFLIGAYALFAIEGMALGKPVVCYLNPKLRAFHPEWDECPIVSANPDSLVSALRDLVADPTRRAELGDRGVSYVDKYHSLASAGTRWTRSTDDSGRRERARAACS